MNDAEAYLTTFALDANGDVVLGPDGTPTLISGQEKVVQDILDIIRTAKGSYAFDNEYGIDYATIVESNFNPIAVENVIKTAVAKHPSVREVTRITAVPGENRVINVEMQVKLYSGKEMWVRVNI